MIYYGHELYHRDGYKYIDKVRTKSGNWRYIYDRPKSSSSSNVQGRPSTDFEKRTREMKQQFYATRRSNTRLVKENAVTASKKLKSMEKEAKKTQHTYDIRRQKQKIANIKNNKEQKALEYDLENGNKKTATRRMLRSLSKEMNSEEAKQALEEGYKKYEQELIANGKTPKSAASEAKALKFINDTAQKALKATERTMTAKANIEDAVKHPEVIAEDLKTLRTKGKALVKKLSSKMSTLAY